METENRNKPKWYVLVYPDSPKPAKIVYGWKAVLEERRCSKIKVSAKGFHTKEVAERYRKKLVSGSVTFRNAKKPQIVTKVESI